MNSEPRTHSKKNPWRKVGLVFLILFSIAIVIAAAAYRSTDIGEAAGKLEANKAALAKTYLVMNDAEWLKRQGVSESDNGANLVKSAAPPQLPQQMEIDDDFMRHNQELLSDGITKLQEATKRKVILEPASDDALSFSSRVESNMRVWTKTLVAMAEYYSGKGDLANSRKVLSIAAFLSVHAGDSQSGIATLIRIAECEVVEAGIRRLIPAHAAETPWMEMFHGILVQLDRPYDLRGVLRYRFQSDLKAYQEFQKEPFNVRQAIKMTDFPLSIRFAQLIPRSFQAFESRIYEQFAMMASELPEDPYNFPQLQRLARDGDEFADRQGWSYDWVRFLSQYFSQFIKAIRKEIATRNALFQAVELLRTHADPAKGLPLKGRYAIDLDDQSIRVKHLPKGWIVYSVWGDGVDDGGNEIEKGHGDLVVHLSPATVPPLVKPKSATVGRPERPPESHD